MATTKKAPFISTPYSGYYHNIVPAVDEELAKVGPGTPAGEWFRRFWTPVGLASDLKDLPLRIRMLGEDLVLFRDKSGQVGCLELHCSHRGTSLEFGLIEEKGIRCCYHGWQFDVDGRILDTPGEPPDSTYKERLCHGAYPTHEWTGLIFAYMGPPDKKPPFFPLDTFQPSPTRSLKPGHFDISPCNWLQMVENGADPIHTTFLHTRSSSMQFLTLDGSPSSEFGDIGEVEYMETPVGMVYINTRRVHDEVWVRMGEIIPPCMQQTPGHPGFPAEYPEGKQEVSLSPRFIKWNVPVDDTHTMAIRFYRVQEGERAGAIAQDQTRSLITQTLGTTGEHGEIVDRSYEERQRNPGDYEAEVSQRDMAVHDLEHLAESDRGVSMWRKIAQQGIRAVQRGEDPKGLITKDSGVAPTYASDTIMRLPSAPTPEEDIKLLRDTGRRVAEGYLKNPRPY